jgi:hydrogenase maturation protease
MFGMSAAGDAPAPIAVIGLGNLLLGDDGFGPTVIELLRAGWQFPECVDLIDAGTPGLALTTYVLDREAVILIDAVAAHGESGELRLYRGAELQRIPMKPRVSPHDPAVGEALAIAEFAGLDLHRVLLVGAIPQSTAAGVGLTDAMRSAADAAAAIVVQELAGRGIHVMRQRFLPVQPWWGKQPENTSSLATRT